VHEEYLGGALSELQDALAARTAIKGECVLVVDGASAAAPAEVDMEATFARLQAEGLTRREAVKQVAQATGRPARDVYRRLLEQPRGEGDD
jgi:16S rRNA (cytidine1402-2'-O)-methyltransferase